MLVNADFIINGIDVHQMEGLPITSAAASIENALKFHRTGENRDLYEGPLYVDYALDYGLPFDVDVTIYALDGSNADEFFTALP